MKIKRFQIEGNKFNCEMSITADTADVFIRYAETNKPVILFKELKLTDLDELSEIFSMAYYELQGFLNKNELGRDSN